LISGPLLDAFDGVDFFNSFSSPVVSQTYICYWLAGFAMWSYCLYRSNSGREVVIGLGRKRDPDEKTTRDYNLGRILFISKFCFILYYSPILRLLQIRSCFARFIRFKHTMQTMMLRQICKYNSENFRQSFDCLCMFLAKNHRKRKQKFLGCLLIASALTVLYGVPM
jgi:hypothetical protein